MGVEIGEDGLVHCGITKNKKNHQGYSKCTSFDPDTGHCLDPEGKDLICAGYRMRQRRLASDRVNDGTFFLHGEIYDPSHVLNFEAQSKAANIDSQAKLKARARHLRGHGEYFDFDTWSAMYDAGQLPEQLAQSSDTPDQP